MDGMSFPHDPPALPVDPDLLRWVDDGGPACCPDPDPDGFDPEFDFDA